VLAHDLLQEGQAVHAGHFNIQRDDIGHLLAHAFSGDEGVTRGADYLNRRVSREYVAQCLAHHRGIVNDEDANSWLAHD